MSSIIASIVLVAHSSLGNADVPSTMTVARKARGKKRSTAADHRVKASLAKRGTDGREPNDEEKEEEDAAASPTGWKASRRLPPPPRAILRAVVGPPAEEALRAGGAGGMAKGPKSLADRQE